LATALRALHGAPHGSADPNRHAARVKATREAALPLVLKVRSMLPKVRHNPTTPSAEPERQRSPAPVTRIRS
jgi:hypothetical protein